MARLTHLAAATEERSIRRAGIKASDLGSDVKGVYAMPVLPNYFVSHQWLRELRRHHAGPIVAVDFVIPDSEHVLAGHYFEAHLDYAASEAAAVIMKAEDPRGYQVVVPRKIEATEVPKVRRVRQIIGWRYSPDAHGRRPCSCEFCQRGSYGGQSIRSSSSL